MAKRKSPRKPRTFDTIGQYFNWHYASLCMAHEALTAGRLQYGRIDYMVRSFMYKRFCVGSSSPRSLLDDERIKLHTTRCCYCGAETELTLDHLVPRSAGGGDSGDNLVYACRKCNSFKNDTDLLVWYLQKKQNFPPLLVLRRYMKLALEEYSRYGILDLPFSRLPEHTAHFRLDLLPEVWPAPGELELMAGD